MPYPIKPLTALTLARRTKKGGGEGDNPVTTTQQTQTPMQAKTPTQ